MLIRNKCGPPNYVKRRNNGNSKMPALTYFATWSIVLCYCLSVLGQATASMSFPITTLINAKWKQTPLYLEIAEYLADENSGLFWNYVQDIIKLEPSLAEYDMESKQYITAMNVVQQHLTKMQLPVLKLLVSMHSLTPRIQTHFQLASELLARGDCRTDNFAQVGLEMACNVGELKQKLHSNADGDSSLDAHVDTYSFDHFYTSTVADNKTRTVVLYGDMGSREFAKFHRLLVQEAQAGRVRYLVRHYLPQEQLKQQRAVRLSGYGVELHLKSTEYKSQDDAPKGHDDKGAQDMASDDEDVDMSVRGFDFKILRERYPSLTNSLDQFRRSLLQGDDEIATLKAWQFQDLGLQAAASIADIEGEETLQILQLTANNFPMQASVLVGRKVSDELRAEIKHNTEVFGRSLNIVPPDGALFINGLFFDADTLDLNALVETLRIEMRVLESLYANNVRGNVASALLALDLTGVGQRDFAIDLRDTAINWINDIENDAQYRRWPASVMDLLRPTFPGMLRNVRKNVFNLALVVDPLHPDGRNLLKLAESFVIHQAPLRLGLVFDGRRATSDKAKQDFNALICAFNYITQKKDARAALSFLTDVYAAVKSDENVREKHIRAQMKRSNSLSSAQIDDILGEDSDYDYGKQLAVEFIERLGYEKSPQALLNGVPMQTSLLKSDSDFEEAIFSEIIQQTSNLQKAVYRGELTDTDTVIDYLMNQPYVMPRLNQRILGGDEELPQRFLDLSGTPHKDLSNVRLLEQLSNRDMTATLLHNLKYFGGKHSEERIGDTKLHFLTFWVFADLNTAAGRQLLKHALLYVKTGSSVRLAFLPNAEGGKLANRYNLNRVAWAAMQSLPAVEATDLVLKLLENHDKEQNKDVKVPKAVEDYLSETELHMKMLRVYAQRVLGLKSGECLVIGNGKIIGPLRKNEKFGIEDFALIERLNSFQYGDKIRKVLTQVDSKSSLEEDDIRDLCSDTLLKLVASLVPRESKTRFKIPDDTQDAHSVVKLPAKHTDLPYFNIAAVVDPASRSAQKLAPILILLRNIVNCRMQIYLTPVEQHSDMPVKNFYRYVVEPEVHFLAHGKLAEGPIAKFIGVPANPLLTQNIQVPDNWLVEAVRSVYDLDNIKLSEIGGPVHSEFELEYLLLEGHCFDATTGAPPRGLQMTLGTKDQPTLVDTIVMANLGYFQLKANPGAWELRLRDGKSADIYDITHVEGPNTQQQANNTIKVIMSSLRSNVIKLRVTKKAGQQNADLLGDEDEKSTGSGIWNSIASSFGGGDANNAGSTGTGSATEIDDAETINIFSVASGHLYERLLRIMMISLLKHTKSPVKFWFLKNYLSPQFTDFLPHMAREYNFKYELVQYKWPRWLHQQTEKQRTIWGYKILFLDVLFPLNVRKIIFVDADAIVRADLKELNEMDLGSAPYAYTPFCDSRTDMEGFRFWKQGYWRSHLMGRRYHISALYVVDLKRFRKIAAGDRLRGQYQALSQDPNSLANLDQDLPNNMIHQVAIKSLPDNWLWCQTWCSDSAFKTAKVIDLCNNPLTKEAKLSAAQRIVPEWKDYDAEIKRLMARVEDHENADHAHDQQQLHEHSSATIKQKDENDVDDEGESHTNLHIEL